MARSALQHGIVVRAAACAGEGWVYEDSNGRPSVLSPAATRVNQLLAGARASAQGRPAFALEGASALLISVLEQRVAGWEKVSDSPTLWLGPASKETPVG